MTSKNDITGDSIQTKVSSDAYRNNYDSIFRKKDKKEVTSARPELKYKDDKEEMND